MSQVRKGPRGPRFVSGEAEDDTARVVLARSDGSQESTPIRLFSGSLVDNGDGTATLTLT